MSRVADSTVRSLDMCEVSEGLNTPYGGAKESQELLAALPPEKQDALFKKALYIAREMRSRMAQFPAPFCEMIDFAVAFGVKSMVIEYDLDVDSVAEIKEQFDKITQKFVDEETGIVLYHYALDTAISDSTAIYKFWAVQKMMREDGVGYRDALSYINMASDDYLSTRDMMIRYIESGIYGEPVQAIL